MKVVEVSEFHPLDFTVEDGKVRILKAYNWYMVEFALSNEFMTTENPRAYLDPQYRMLSILDGTGKMHLEFKVLKDIPDGSVIFKLPEDAPNNLDKASAQTWDGGTIWYNSNNRNIYGKGLRAGRSYAVDLVGFFGD
jgi:hypothetical protein|nr:MAG TPA: hypothetical protein [Caudoviricetes sp.]